MTPFCIECGGLADSAAKDAACLSVAMAQLRRQHRVRVGQAKLARRLFLDIQCSSIQKLQEIAPRKSAGVILPARKDCVAPVRISGMDGVRPLPALA